MNGNCHFIYGTAVSSMLALNIDKICVFVPNLEAEPYLITTFVMGGLIGGILPDIDNPKSYMGKLSKPISTWIYSIGEIFGKSNSNHRGIFHDFGLYLIGFILSYFYAPFLLGLFLGCMSHCFLDMFTPSGIPFLLGVKQIHLGSMPSDSKGAVFFCYANVLLVLMLGISIKFFL